MRKSMIAATAVLALTSCSVAGQDPPTGDPEQTLSAEPSVTEVVDVVSGRSLSEFEGSATYEWRKAIAQDPDELLDQMQAIASHLEEDDLSDLLSTCDSIDRDIAGTKLVDQSVVRFSGGPDEQIAPDQAKALIKVAQAEVCP
jgi:hypothetical protein